MIFGLALITRLAAAILVDQYVTRADRQFLIEGDANGYWELAGHIAAGRDYAIHTPPRYVLRTPGFPLLLAASIRLFGDSLLAARLVLAVVGALCCLATWLLGRRLLGDQVAVLAATWVAVNPIHIGNSVLILSETWFALGMLLSLLCLQQLWTTMCRGVRPAILWGILCGLTTGVTMLIRPGYLLWLPLAGGTLLIAHIGPHSGLHTGAQRFRRRILAIGCLVAGFAVVAAPWAIRNQRVTGHLVLTSLWSGPSLYDGLNPQADGRSDMTFFDSENVMQRMSEYEMNAHYRDRAVEFVLDEPVRAISLAFSKASQYLQPVPNSLAGRNWAIQAGCVAVWGLLLIGIIAAAVRCRPQPGAWLLTAGPFCLFLAVHMVFVGSVRYRLPLEFPLSVLSAAGWLALTRGHRRESCAAGV